MTRFLSVMPRLPVEDLVRTLTFYVEYLGFQVGSQWPDESPTFALAFRDEACVQFFVPEESVPAPCGHATLQLDVDDALAVHAALEGKVPIEWGPEVYWYGRREFAVRDPSGYLLILTEETEDAPTCEDG